MALRIEEVTKQLQEQGRGRIPGRAPIVTYGLPLPTESTVIIPNKKNRKIILFVVLDQDRNIQCSHKRVGGGTKLSAAKRNHYLKR